MRQRAAPVTGSSDSTGPWMRRPIVAMVLTLCTASSAGEPGTVSTVPLGGQRVCAVDRSTAVVIVSRGPIDQGRSSTTAFVLRIRYVGAGVLACQRETPSARSYELSLPPVWTSSRPLSVMLYESPTPIHRLSSCDRAGGGGAAEAATVIRISTASTSGRNQSGTVERVGDAYVSGSPRSRPRSMMIVVG